MDKNLCVIMNPGRLFLLCMRMGKERRAGFPYKKYGAGSKTVFSPSVFNHKILHEIKIIFNLTKSKK